MKMMSKLIVSAFAVLPVVASAQDSAHSFTGNVTLTSDYLYRGLSKTDNNPAIQGGFEYSHESGLYAGTWASNIDGADNLELDWYGGFTGEYNGFTYDLKGIYYQYPSSGEGNGADYWEVGPSVSYTFGGDFEPTLGVGFMYADDFSYHSGEAWWTYADFTAVLPNDFGLGLHVGNQSIDLPVAWGAPSWVEYNASLTKAIGPYTFGVKVSDTDLNKAECFGGANICDTTVVFSVSGSF